MFTRGGYAIKDTELDSHKFIGQDKKPVSIEGHKYYIGYSLKKGAAEPGELKKGEKYETAGVYNRC